MTEEGEAARLAVTVAQLEHALTARVRVEPEELARKATAPPRARDTPAPPAEPNAPVNVGWER